MKKLGMKVLKEEYKKYTDNIENIEKQLDRVFYFFLFLFGISVILKCIF